MGLGRVSVSGRIARSGRVSSSTRVRDPQTILGARLCGLYEADACNVSGGLATTIYDKSGTGNTSTSAAALTWNASSTNFAGRPTWSFNGTSSTFQVSTFLLGKPSSAIFSFLVLSISATLNAATLVGYGTQYQHREAILPAQKMQVVTGGRSAVSTGTFVLNTPMTTYCWAAEPVGSLQACAASVAGSADSLAAAAPNAVMASSSVMQFGAAFGGSSNFITAEVAAIVVGNGVPSADEEAGMIRWAQRKFGVAG